MLYAPLVKHLSLTWGAFSILIFINLRSRVKMVNFKEDENLKTLNHSCAHLMAQAVKHLYPDAKFWVGLLLQKVFTMISTLETEL